MNTFTPTERDTRQAEKIRRQYLERGQNKMQQLKRLDDQVKAPGKAVAGIAGGVGALVMGAGMSMIMVDGAMRTGLVLSIPGMLLALAAYPLYMLITSRRKKTHAAEIMRLSKEVVGD